MGASWTPNGPADAPAPGWASLRLPMGIVLSAVSAGCARVVGSQL